MGAMRVAAYRGVRRLALGVDSEGTRHILNGGSCLSVSTPQQRLLRQFFWLRSLAGLEVTVFQVRSADNPTDPASRLHQLAARWVGVRNARCLLVR